VPVLAKSRTITGSFESNNPKKFALQTMRLKRRSNIVVIKSSRRNHRFVNPICMRRYILRIVNSSRSGLLPRKSGQFSFFAWKRGCQYKDESSTIGAYVSETYRTSIDEGKTPCKNVKISSNELIDFVGRILGRTESMNLVDNEGL
jgi:hypothetical protein